MPHQPERRQKKSSESSNIKSLIGYRAIYCLNTEMRKSWISVPPPRNYQGYFQFRQFLLTGNGMLLIRFKQQCENSEIFGKISTFNLWSYVMEKDEIIHMSYECGKDAGNVLSWLVVREILNGTPYTHSPSTCNVRNGKLGESFKHRPSCDN